MTNESFYFDPAGKGLSVFLGPTEAALMELAWKHKTLTVKLAVTLLGKTNRPAYTTVMTILNRLTSKELLSRTRDGRHFIYAPTSNRNDFINEKIAIVNSALNLNFPDN